METEAQGVAFRAPDQGLSWVNQIRGLVDRLPLPWPVCYLIAAGATIVLFVLNDWLTLGRPLEALQPFHLVLALEPVYALALIHLLDVRAASALEWMRPLLIIPEAYEHVHTELTQLPRRLTLIASIGGVIIGFGAVFLERTALPAAFRPIEVMGPARVFVEIWLILGWFVFGALFVHTIHQLRLINVIYTRHTAIDLDNYSPLFHFSIVSALTAIGLLVIPYAWYAAVPDLIRDPVGVVFGAAFPALALMSFLWPLIGVHNLMVEAKSRAFFENARILKEVRGRFYTQASAGSLDGATDVHDALEAIRAERAALMQVPTWPWQPGTPRSVAAALMLPLAVWFLQWVIQKLFGLLP